MPWQGNSGVRFQSSVTCFVSVGSARQGRGCPGGVVCACWASSGRARPGLSRLSPGVPGLVGLSLGTQLLRVPLAPGGLPGAPGALGPAGAHPACRRALL